MGRRAASRSAGADGKIETVPLEEARKTLGPFADALALDQQISGERAKRVLGWSPKAALCWKNSVRDVVRPALTAYWQVYLLPCLVSRVVGIGVEGGFTLELHHDHVVVFARLHLQRL